MENTATAQRANWWPIAIGPLIVMLLLGTFLRLHDLGKQPLWADELATWHTSQHNTLPEVFEATPGPWPPGHYFLIHFVLKYTVTPSSS